MTSERTEAEVTAVSALPIQTHPMSIPATFTAVPQPSPSATPIRPITLHPPQKSLPTPTLQIPAGFRRIIGFSAERRPIYSYQFGNGSVTFVFIGGVHGGHEWNTILLAYKAIDYFQQSPETIPPEIKLLIVPVVNPDGQALITGSNRRFTPDDIVADTFPGRFNGNGVDLNRNWDCDWSPTAVWRDEPVSAGAKPFSEPETRALRYFLLAQQPTAVVFWHSAANGVYASDCHKPFPASLALAELYSEATGYPLRSEFTSYAITGDASNWLATQKIRAITVELKSNEAIEWEQNLEGMIAVWQAYNSK